MTGRDGGRDAISCEGTRWRGNKGVWHRSMDSDLDANHFLYVGSPLLDDLECEGGRIFNYIFLFHFHIGDYTVQL